MKNYAFISIYCLGLVFYMSNAHAQSAPAISLNGDEYLVESCMSSINGDVTCFTSEDRDEVDEGGPAPPGGCSTEDTLLGSYCMDTCPEGMACDGSCQSCAPINIKSCTYGDFSQTGTPTQCYDDCGALNPEGGYVCDPSCSYCMELLSNYCNLGLHQGELECYDFCPPGEECDENCFNCIRDEVPCEPYDTDTAQGCQDNCPEPLECDEACEVCIYPPPEEPEEIEPPTEDPPVIEKKCSYDEAGQCVDKCPEDFECDSGCEGCVPSESEETPCPIVSEGGDPYVRICLDNCPPETKCHPECLSCIPIPKLP